MMLYTCSKFTHFESPEILISPALGGGGKVIKAESVIGARFLLETYLDGDEVDVDVIMSDGEWQFAAVSDNGPTWGSLM